MSTQSPDVEAILARIDALEKHNRRLKRVVALGLSLLTLSTLCAFSAASQKPASKSDVDRAGRLYMMGLNCHADKHSDPNTLYLSTDCDMKNLNKLTSLQDKLDYLAVAISANASDLSASTIGASLAAKDQRRNTEILNQVGAVAADDHNTISHLRNAVNDLRATLDGLRLRHPELFQ